MHISSYLKVQAFLQVHAQGAMKVLDIGAAVYGAGQGYRRIADELGLAYTGLDMQPGRNVDIVPQHPLLYDELPTDSFDFVISGQAFEHNPYFWVTFCEVARLLVPGGQAMIVAPSAGNVHRYPYDCWRFYPDSWAVLCAMTGLEIREVLFEPKENIGRVGGAVWGDSAVVAAKPRFASVAEAQGFHARLTALTWPYRHVRTDIAVHHPNHGPVWERYTKLVDEVEALAVRRKAREAAAAAAATAPPQPPAAP